jgi:beta-ribofuranosylaminobenzene 5'-phosphate synthase
VTGVSIRTPSRLHFGLLSWGDAVPRRFGSVGLMIDRPGLELSAVPSDEWRAEGPLAGRSLRIATAVAARLAAEGLPPVPLRITIHCAPPEHVGLGTGTQLSLAVARCLALAAGLEDSPVARLATWAGRGLRSGIGLHGFHRGGLIVDGGRLRLASDEATPPLLCRHDFPADWSILVVIPPIESGFFGADESRAFAALPPFPETLVDRLCRLVLLGLLPAVVERDLPSFGAALDELQHRVGEAFAPAQGGTYAHSSLAAIVAWLRRQGLQGVGQSSWGPTLYGFLQADEECCDAIVRDLRRQFGLGADAAFWSLADNTGARIDRHGDRQ